MKSRLIFVLAILVLFACLTSGQDVGCEALPSEGPSSPIIFLDHGEADFNPSILRGAPLTVTIWLYFNTTLQYAPSLS